MLVMNKTRLPPLISTCKTWDADLSRIIGVISAQQEYRTHRHIWPTT